MLIIGGVIAAMAAVWHLLMIIGGPGWYSFAHAPYYIVESARQRTLVAPVAAILIATLMFTCTLYAFSGAGIIRKIPLLKSALITIAVICLTRALVTIPYLVKSKLDIWNLVASSGWFFVGVCFLLGAVTQFTKHQKHI